MILKFLKANLFSPVHFMCLQLFAAKYSWEKFLQLPKRFCGQKDVRLEIHVN